MKPAKGDGIRDAWKLRSQSMYTIWMELSWRHHPVGKCDENCSKNHDSQDVTGIEMNCLCLYTILVVIKAWLVSADLYEEVRELISCCVIYLQPWSKWSWGFMKDFLDMSIKSINRLAGTLEITGQHPSFRSWQVEAPLGFTLNDHAPHQKKLLTVPLTIPGWLIMTIMLRWEVLLPNHVVRVFILSARD